jgi:hypothetical protein
MSLRQLALSTCLWLVALAQAEPVPPYLTLEPITLTVTERPRASTEKMSSRDQGNLTIIYWPTATAKGGISLVIDHCLRFGQDCGKPAADAACRRLMPSRPMAVKYLTARPRNSATVVLGAGMDYCWDKVCTGFSELHCTAAQAAQPGAPAPAVQHPTARDPRSCKQGFVWREARPGDLVCVSPSSRQRVAGENATAASRVDPNGAYGPASCTGGFVWRETFPGDTVCVRPETRALVAEENRLAATRRVGG